MRAKLTGARTQRSGLLRFPAGRKIRARLKKGLCVGCGKSPCVCKNTRQVRKARELVRVEAAILEGTKSELEWACQRRARTAWNPSHKRALGILDSIEGTSGGCPCEGGDIIGISPAALNECKGLISSGDFTNLRKELLRDHAGRFS
jgi:hypothetical protein